MKRWTKNGLWVKGYGLGGDPSARWAPPLKQERNIMAQASLALTCLPAALTSSSLLPLVARAQASLALTCLPAALTSSSLLPLVARAQASLALTCLPAALIVHRYTLTVLSRYYKNKEQPFVLLLIILSVLAYASNAISSSVVTLFCSPLAMSLSAMVPSVISCSPMIAT